MRRMDERDFQHLVKKDLYQVFLFTSPGTLPFAFARHPWFVVNSKGSVSRWEIFYEASKKGKISWGHLHKNCYEPWQGIEMFFFSDTCLYGSTLRGTLEGGEGSLAHRVADLIESSPEAYPYNYRYSLYPGPNSNTYAQWVLGHFPQSTLRLPWNSFGKRPSTGFSLPSTAKLSDFTMPEHKHPDAHP